MEWKINRRAIKIAICPVDAAARIQGRRESHSDNDNIYDNVYDDLP